MKKITVGFALCGSFCTFSKVIPEIENLSRAGYDIVPIMSHAACTTDTRFGTAKEFTRQIEEICGRPIIKTVAEAEPIGPGKLLDALIIAPCTGNTAAKLANGVTDTSVTMAAKAQLRNCRPLIIAISTNDGLGLNLKNIGTLAGQKNVFFVPYGQDDPFDKTNSLVADMTKIPATLIAALSGIQLQPVLIAPHAAK